MSNIQISAVILTKNEERNIASCIESVKWCDEIIVIDDLSEDKTVEIAQSLGAMVYKRGMERDYATQRNFGLEKARGEWVLFLDADERVSQALAFEIQARLIAPGYIGGFFCKRIDTMWGKVLKYGETSRVRILRLARKDAGEWKGKVHEVWKIHGKVDEFTHSLLHYPHPTVTDFLQEINTYTTLRAEELYNKKVRAHVLDIIVYPKAKFVVNYIVKLGFLDGIPGLISALMMSLHSFLVRGKLWILWHKK